MSEVEGGLDEPEELEPEQGTLALAAPEDGHDRTAWEAAAAKVLRRAGRLAEEDPDSAVWEALAFRTLDDVRVTPLGTPELVRETVTSGRPQRAGDWDVRTHLEVRDAKAANEALLVDLANGATSLWLETRDATELGTVLDDVLLDLAPLVLDARQDPVAAAEALVALLDERGVTPAAGTNLGSDPVGVLVRQPDARVDDAAVTDPLVRVARLARDSGVLGVVVDGTAVHDLGASDAQELGYTLAVGAAYLRMLTAAGLELDEAVGLVEFRYAATDEQFPTIAKLRAARRLWARVLELSEASPAPQRQHVVTSRPMMSRYDPWVNMLRTTVAAFAAGVGGADAVTVLPFDSALGVPDALGRRIARNTSSLLISESHVARVADPAGGAYAVEKLTDDLAVAGWQELGRIEEAGGILAALADGSLRARIEAVAADRDAQVARRTRPLTGVSEFPNLAETLPEREPDDSFAGVRAYGAGFEALRDDPVTDHVFLATMGSVAAHTARATFASNLLAAGGVGVDEAGATSGTEDVLAAYNGQAVVCLAGPDAAYAEWGPDVVSALREAGATWVVVAGRPGDLEVDDSCAMGVDALDFLRRTRRALGARGTNGVEGEDLA